MTPFRRLGGRLLCRRKVGQRFSEVADRIEKIDRVPCLVIPGFDSAPAREGHVHDVGIRVEGKEGYCCKYQDM